MTQHAKNWLGSLLAWTLFVGVVSLALKAPDWDVPPPPGPAWSLYYVPARVRYAPYFDDNRVGTLDEDQLDENGYPLYFKVQIWYPVGNPEPGWGPANR